MRAGILIIGSLFWDSKPTINGDHIRKLWRDSRLVIEKTVPVRAPIRYGRWTDSRKTYTMVFSRLCLRSDYGLGTALAVPLKNNIQTGDDLINEAEQLWHVEHNKGRNGQISSSWGCVTLLKNPATEIPSRITTALSNRILKTKDYGNFMHSKSEGRLITPVGQLRIPWPHTVDSQVPLPFDILLATATAPMNEANNRIYPSIHEIVSKITDEQDNYFNMNIGHGIMTYQDDVISELITRRKPQAPKMSAEA